MKTENRRALFSTLWIFLTANYIYCDVFSHMQPEVLKDLVATGELSGLQVTEQLLLGSSILMEIPIAMILLSRVLKFRANRWANMIAGAIMAVAQIGMRLKLLVICSLYGSRGAGAIPKSSKKFVTIANKRSHNV